MSSKKIKKQKIKELERQQESATCEEEWADLQVEIRQLWREINNTVHARVTPG